MLSNAYFYHRLTRKYVILFGNMFNNITVKRINRTEDVEIERFKVPIDYYSSTQRLRTCSEGGPILASDPTGKYIVAHGYRRSIRTRQASRELAR